MRKFRHLILFLILFSASIVARSQPGSASIIDHPIVKTTSGLIVKQGFLVVPENRKKPNGRKIQVPFIFVRKPGQSAVKNVFLYSTGGPGYSSIGNLDSIGPRFGFLDHGGFIVFDQRGTRRSKPALDCPEVAEAIKSGYLDNLDTDSLARLAVKKCKDKFVKEGVDLSSYNSTESAADINDLRIALGIDSVHLVGISYSGGLMLTVARNHPEGVQTLILKSPLPVITNYEEDALLNINEAFVQVFSNCGQDSACSASHPNIRQRFQDYFSSITGKKFKFIYKPKHSKDSVTLTYTKHELLDIIVDKLNSFEVSTVPSVIEEMIQGSHEKYIRTYFDGLFSAGGGSSLGMRYSVFCSEQVNLSNEMIEKKQAALFPWLSEFKYNNVDHSICSCWNVRSQPQVVKSPVYSNIPVLLSGGDIDPWCRPFYNYLIKRTMPNTHILTVHNAGHTPPFTVDGTDYLKMFLEDPFGRMLSRSKNVRID